MIEKINNNSQAVDPFFSMIEKVSLDPNFDISKLEKLIDMWDKKRLDFAKSAFYEALSCMQEELPKVVAKHANSLTKSKYAKIQDINEAITPSLSKFGFAVSFKVEEQKEDKITVRAFLHHKNGHSESTPFSLTLDNKGAQGNLNKNNVHASGSTLTYARRYALCLLLNISVGDDDDDGNAASKASEPINEAQRRTLQDLIDATKSDIEAFCKHFKCSSLKDLKSFQYNSALSSLKTKSNTMKQGNQI